MDRVVTARDNMLGRTLGAAAASSIGPGGLVRADHPKEALEAAARIGPAISKQQALILSALRRDGATAAELEARTGLAGSSVRPRLVELTGKAATFASLVAEPLVVRTDRTRKTRSGRNAAVYELTEAGVRSVAAMEAASP